MSEEVKVEPNVEEVKVAEEEVRIEAVAPDAEVKTDDAAPSAEAEVPAEEAGEAEQQDGGEDEGEGEGEDEAGEGEEAEPGGEDAAAAEAETNGDSAKRKRESHVGPLTLGYKTFGNSKECADYFKHLLSSSPMDTDMNEYEYRILLDLVQKGHPAAATKIGVGLRSFQVRQFNSEVDTRAFFAIRKDGTLEDFSYVKCLGQIFPDEISFHPNKRSKDYHGHGGQRRSSDGGRGGGRGGGNWGRGRGGFRGGRGGGRGRGGRGRGRGGRY